MESVLFFIYLFLWIGLTVLRARTEGYYTLFFLFGLGGLLYFSSIPLEMFLRGEEFYVFHGLVEFLHEKRVSVLIMAILALIGFYLGLYLSRFRIISVNKMQWYMVQKSANRYLRDAKILLLAVWFTSGMILVGFYRDLLSMQRDYTAAYGITYSSPMYSFIKMHFLISSCVMASLAIQVKTRKAIIVSVFLLSVVLYISVLTSDKAPILLSLLSMATFLTTKRISFIKFCIVSMIGTLAVIVLMPLFSLYRSNIPPHELIPYLQDYKFSFARIDPGGPITPLIYIMDNDVISLRYGGSYLSSLGTLVPKIVWPDRPLTLSEEFARENIPDWVPGRGMGFSPLAEALLNFNIIGAFFHFFAYAFLVGCFFRFIQRKIFRYHTQLLVAFVYVIGFYVLIMSFRGSGILVLKQLLIYFAPYCMGFYLIKNVRGIVVQVTRGSKRKSKGLVSVSSSEYQNNDWRNAKWR